MTPRAGEISPQGASALGGTEPVERNRLKPRRGEENGWNGPASRPPLGGAPSPLRECSSRPGTGHGEREGTTPHG